ncbi:MAG: cupin-like domain-containing protein [Cellvibrionaceae bacterium]
MDIERRSTLSRKQFVAEFVVPNRPVILTDLSAHWEAREKFTPDFFRQHYPHVRLDVRGREYQLGYVLDQFTPGPATAELSPCKLNLRDPQFGDLARMVEPRPDIICPDRTHNPLIPRRLLEGLYDLEIFFGGAGGEFPYLHYDFLGLYALINQLYGEKEFTVFPPEQQKFLYPLEDRPWVSQIENHHNPDLERYPLFKHATPIKIVVKPGETLFIPKKWYHTARSLSPTISVAMDQLCHFNWGQFTEECLLPRKNHPIKSFAVKAYLNAIGNMMSARERLGGGL